MFKHFGFYDNNIVVGYCCINAEVQFFLSPKSAVKAAELFALIAPENSAVLMGEIKGIFVSTAELNYLSLCLDNASSFKVNALMYLQGPVYSLDVKAPLTINLAKPDNLLHVLNF